MPICEALLKKGGLVDNFMLKMLKRDVSNEFYEIVKHQIAVGGKRLRPTLTILSCEAVGGNTQMAIPAAAAIELVHNYTLIFDDIIDRSDLRRGSQTVRAKYSDVMAILAGMHYREVIFEATKNCDQWVKIEETLGATVRRIIEGERLDVLFEQAGRESEYIEKMKYRTIAEKDYSRMISAKTASLFEAACKVGSIVANGISLFADCLSEYGWNCGMAFQIRDDILDIAGETEELGKEAGKDIKEHKLGNLAILYSLEELAQPLRTKLLEMLESEHISDHDVKVAVKTILSTKAIERALKKSENFVEKAKSSINPLPPSNAKNTLLSLADFIIEREV